MPGLVPGIHVRRAESKTWMAGSSPAMTPWKLEKRRKPYFSSSPVNTNFGISHL
jgi:hypothetical protein